MVGVRRIAPIFPVRDLTASLPHYQKLGFATREYAGGGYGYAVRDDVELHLGVVSDANPAHTSHSAYLFVDDADALASAWRDAGAEVHMPQDTQWGQHEGSPVDPAGNWPRQSGSTSESQNFRSATAPAAGSWIIHQ